MVFNKCIICRMQLSICLWSTISHRQGFSGWAALALPLLLRLTPSLGGCWAGHPARPQHQPWWPSRPACCRTCWHREGQATCSIPPPAGRQKCIWTRIWEVLLSLAPATSSPPLWVSCEQQMCLGGAVVGSWALPWAALLTRKGDIVFKVHTGAAFQHRTNFCNKVLAGVLVLGTGEKGSSAQVLVLLRNCFVSISRCKVAKSAFEGQTKKQIIWIQQNNPDVFMTAVKRIWQGNPELTPRIFWAILHSVNDRYFICVSEQMNVTGRVFGLDLPHQYHWKMHCYGNTNP